jgi:NAD dependent epimerase/dehydratase family enzyme
MDDVVAVIDFILQNESVRGPVNAVAPQPVTNQEFTRTLGRVLARPTFMTMPAFAARLAFGEMADEMMLSSTRVAPKVLEGAGYKFRYPQLGAALEHLLA